MSGSIKDYTAFDMKGVGAGPHYPITEPYGTFGSTTVQVDSYFANKAAPTLADGRRAYLHSICVATNDGANPTFVRIQSHTGTNPTYWRMVVPPATSVTCRLGFPVFDGFRLFAEGVGAGNTRWWMVWSPG